MHLRLWIALALGVAVGFAAYHWPASPRAAMQAEHICWDFVFSHDSTKLALLDREAGLNARGQVLVWDVATGDLLQRLDNGRSVFASKVVFAPDDQTLGIMGAGVVTKWDLDTGLMVGHHDHAAWSHDPDHHHGREILFSPEGRWLAHDAHEGRVYEVETGRIVKDYQARWPDRSRSAQGGSVAALVNGEIKTFDVLTGAEVGVFPTTIQRATMAGSAFTFSADGSQGVFFDKDRWVVHNGAVGRRCALATNADPVLDCCWSADQRLLAVSLALPSSGNIWDLLRMGPPRRRVQVFDTTTGAEVCRPIRNGMKSRFAPDGKTLAVTDGGNGIALWDWPPPSRWPPALALAAATIMLSYGIGWWRSRRRNARLARIHPQMPQIPAKPL
jgi:WD40 repeat protein